MARYIDGLLKEFRSCFSREAAFRWFAVIITAMILREDHLGVTSVVRALCLNHGCYDSMIRFFRSDAYSTQRLREKWYSVVSKRAPLLQINGMYVLAGDGVKQSKEGFYMPGVKKLHQESENSSKPEYIFGHLFGAVGIMIGNFNHFLCLPLRMGIQDGIQAAAGWMDSTISRDSHVVQMISNGYEAARVIGRCVLLLDRYFLTVPALKRMAQLNASADGDRLAIVTKAKANCRAFEKPEPKKAGTRGRPRKKGRAVLLGSLFEAEAGAFKNATVTAYGEQKEIRYFTKKLLWGQKLYQELLFVLVIWDGKRSILVSTDTSLDPVIVIELYAMRQKIERSFREFKQWFGGFGYHFWTKAVGKLDHFKRKEEADRLTQITDAHKQKLVLKAIDATERFVLLACIAMGIVQMAIFNEKMSGEAESTRYLRTKSKGKVSEETLKYYLRRTLLLSLMKEPDLAIMQYILGLQSPPVEEKQAS